MEISWQSGKRKYWNHNSFFMNDKISLSTVNPYNAPLICVWQRRPTECFADRQWKGAANCLNREGRRGTLKYTELKEFFWWGQQRDLTFEITISDGRKSAGRIRFPSDEAEQATTKLWQYESWQRQRQGGVRARRRLCRSWGSGKLWRSYMHIHTDPRLIHIYLLTKLSKSINI